MIIPEITKRQSIRQYETRSIPPDVMERLMAVAQQAPTAKNGQDWVIVVVDDAAKLSELVDQAAPHQPFLKTAPVILAACATNPTYIMRCGQAAYPIDIAIVLDHISLQAVREGLGTCWIGSFDEAAAKRALAVPEPNRIVQLMSLGYPCDPHRSPGRKKIADLFKSNTW